MYHTDLKLKPLLSTFVTTFRTFTIFSILSTHWVLGVVVSVCYRIYSTIYNPRIILTFT